MNEKTKSILAYIFGFIGGLIVLFALQDNERNTKIHAAQAVVISAGYSILSMAYAIIPLTIPFFSSALWIIYILAIIFGIVKANKEEEPELPVVADIAKNIFKKQIEEGPISGE